MSNNAKQTKRRRRGGGVPTALVVGLLVIAIIMGGLLGFALARHTNPADDRLQKANERIIELENTLSLIGFPEGGDPEAFAFDDAAYAANPAEDLAGTQAEAESEDVWTEDESLLTGMLTDSGDPVVVAEFDGGQLLSTEVIPVFNDHLTTQIFSGYSADEVSDSVLQDVLTELTSQKLIAAKAAELGLDQVTDEERATVQAEATRRYNEQIGYFTAFVDKEGLTPDQIQAAAEKYMREEAHITEETLAAELLTELPAEKYYAHVTGDVTVSDADVQALYDERLAEQRAAFTEYPEEFEYAHSEGELVLYNLDGYRAVQNLQLSFANDEDAARAQALTDQLDRLDPMKDADAEQIKALEAELDPLYAPLEATAQEIADKLQAGENFATLMDQYGADAQMTKGALRDTGYYISDHSFLFSTEFIQGSMILDHPGQVSSPLRSGSGLHLVKYLKDVAPGEVSLEDVRDAVEAEALKAKRDAAYEEHVAALLDQSNVRYYPERLQ